MPCLLDSALLAAALTFANTPQPEQPEQPDALQLPAPVLTPAPAPAPLALRTVDSRRPMPGTGLITLGAMGMGISSAILITAVAGPGWGELDRREAAILAGLSIPATAASAGLLIGGIKAHRKYKGWAERNELSPPAAGNGTLVVGAGMSLVGAASMGAATHLAISDPGSSRAGWASVAIAGLFTGVGVAILVSGLLTRSKFAAWERTGYLAPGPLALRGGGGLSLSGSF